MSERKRARLQSRPSILRKRFTDVVDVSKRVDASSQVHPLFVIADLRRGSLESLDLYLEQNGAIADRALALELRKLISGTHARTKYRLSVIDHPDSSVLQGGRPKKPKGVRYPSDRDFELARSFAETVEISGTIDAAIFAVAVDKGVSEKTVKRARKRVAAHLDSIRSNQVKAESEHSLAARHRAAIDRLQQSDPEN